MYQGGKFDLPIIICLPALLIDVIYLHPRLSAKEALFKATYQYIGAYFCFERARVIRETVC